MNNWTRSIQRVEGIGVVVDIRPGLSGMTIHRTTDDGRGTEQLPRALESDVRWIVGNKIGDLLPLARITVRLDTSVRLGAHDAADCVSRALRMHLAGVNVEQMDASVLS